MDNRYEAATAFLMSVNDIPSANAYEEMLRKNGVRATIERVEPAGVYAAVAESKKSSVTIFANLYVSPDQLETARDLVNEFDNQPIVFTGPPPVLNQKSRINQILFAIIIMLIIVIPLGAALTVIVTRVIRFLSA